jgi:hydroxymethylpyrimidine pyrophosphatase-like HAD family hydrolase
MKLSAIALDYDGTAARDGVLDPDVRQAIGVLRAQGLVIVLVTGRILDDLHRCTGGTHFVDAVVAENGGVLEFPDSGHKTAIAEPPPAIFVEALHAARISFALGQTLVDANANDAEGILRIIRRLELPLTFAFNRGRLMVLSQGISKATGLKHALTVLRLSPHNTVAVGDAENDHELLRICEFGAAVAWGSDRLKAVADDVVPGGDAAALAGYLQTMLRSREIPTRRHTRRRLLVGYDDRGEALSLAIRGRNVLVAGDPKSGKSWVAGLLCEQLIVYGYCVCVLDPEGDYTSLGTLPGVSVVGGADPLPRPRELLRALRHPDASLVVDLSQTPHDSKLEYLRNVLPGLAALRRHTGLPHRIVVDEAHYFLGDGDLRSRLDLDLNGYTLVTYRASKLDQLTLLSNQAVIVTRESDPSEVRALVTLYRGRNDGRTVEEWTAALGSLLIGEAAVLPITDESGGELRRIRLAPRLTPHVRHLAKYIDIPVLPSRAFVFWSDGAPTGTRAGTLREFVRIVETSAEPVLAGHLQRGDFSRWVAEVFGDYPLAIELRRLETRYRAGTLGEPGAAFGQAIRSRYEFIDPGPPSSPDSHESRNGPADTLWCG